ncbi:hypothetical protein ABET15_04285 [Heyndrickxia faecalis]|uniref:hypothetical protein n=1 Tax=Heyndrickxia TaxID=2837504 RepID=UPI002E1F7A19|nr:hypothetical protein [Weizmannia sp. CD-2023]
MRPDLKDQIKEWKREHREVTGFGKKKKRRKKAENGKSEHLTESDIKSLMGMNRPIYERHRGAFRQK